MRANHHILNPTVIPAEARGNLFSPSAGNFGARGVRETEPNFVRMKSGEMHQYISPEDVPSKMASLVEWHRQQDAKNDLHPLFHAALFHHQFALIHPFDDGNGRMARILMNLFLMRAGFPPVVIKLQNKKIALLKQELSNIAEPLTLNTEIQLDFITRCVKPCFNRLVKKLGQFDDLYSEDSFGASIMLWANPQLTTQAMWNSPPQLTKHDAMDRIERTLLNQKIVFANMQFHFSWNGFRKAGTNTFADACQLYFTFQKHQYSVSAMHAGNSVFNYGNVYQIPLNEEQILKIVNGLTEACLKFIEQQVRQKK